MSWLTNLMIDASCGGRRVRSMSSSSPSSRTLTSSPSSTPSDWSVSAPTPSTRLATRSMSAAGARAGRSSRPGGDAQPVERAGVERVAGGDLGAAVGLAQRQQLVLEEEPRGEARQQLARRVEAVEVDVVEPEPRRQEPQHALFGAGVVGRAQGFGQGLSALDGGADVQRGLVLEQTLAHQQIDDVVHRTHNPPRARGARRTRSNPRRPAARDDTPGVLARRQTPPGTRLAVGKDLKPRQYKEVDGPVATIYHPPARAGAGERVWTVVRSRPWAPWIAQHPVACRCSTGIERRPSCAECCGPVVQAPPAFRIGARRCAKKAARGDSTGRLA